MSFKTVIRLLLLLVLAFAASASAPPRLAWSAPIPTPLPAIAGTATLDDSTRRALELQSTIFGLQSERTSIQTRTEVIAARIIEQTAILDRAREELKAAQTAYNERAVEMYKLPGYDEISIILDSESWTDLVTRVTVVSRILEFDRILVEEAAVIESQAEYQTVLLDELRAQDADLRTLDSQRQSLIQSAQTELASIETSLTTESHVIIDGRKTLEENAQRDWLNSSVPLTTVIKPASGTVTSNSGLSYVVSDLGPNQFRTTGGTFTAMCSTYGGGFDGKPTASGQIYNGRDFTCASQTLPFGTWLAVTLRDKRVIVVVTDRGPFATGRDLELSTASAEALGLMGVESVQVENVEPDV